MENPRTKYSIRVTREDYETSVESVPDQWDANVTAYVRWPGPLNETMAVKVGWSCGAKDHDPEDARIFFKAGLKVCRAAERELKRGPKKVWKENNV